MPGKIDIPQASPYRLQGTDGIRREVMPAASPDLKGLTPQQAFIEKGVITEELMELYSFAHIKNLMEEGGAKPGCAFVVGWDPRDVSGEFTQALVRGVRKAGATALVLGIVPTPLVPMFLLYKKAAGGFMVTASHNPKNQNGIKTFLADRGMKLLPENDIALTSAILSLNYKSLAKKPLKGKPVDCRLEATELFKRFSLEPENSWAGDVGFKDIILVVDPANGSLTGIAAEIFGQAGFGTVIEVNNKLNGDVNLNSGVADLEGCPVITSAMTSRRSGIFSKHQAVLQLFKLGRRHKDQILAGKRKVCGAVFDADGDRFYRLDYHPGKDTLLVLSGDETAYLQAEFLMQREPKKYKGTYYLNTVESDLNTGSAAEKLGFRNQLSAVGDKWILRRIALMEAKKTKGRDIPFAIGSEQTGHTITPGLLEGTPPITVYSGNGMKSALNTFAATQFLLRNKNVKSYFSKLEKPFKKGFKDTLYAYYIRKDLFHKNSRVWRRIKKMVMDEAKGKDMRCSTLKFPEDPDMLYLELIGSKTPASGRSGIFIRNSGTENKISVNLRGDKKSARDLKSIGEQCIRFLMTELKDKTSRPYKMELSLVRQAAQAPLAEEALDDPSFERLIVEMVKQGFLKPTEKGCRLTTRGKWYNAHA